jgi:hypothetical protein
MQTEMLRDTVSPRLVMIRGYEYTRVKLATAYPSSTPVGGRSQRVSDNVRTGEEICARIVIVGAARVCTKWWPGVSNGDGAPIMSEWRSSRADSAWAL